MLFYSSAQKTLLMAGTIPPVMQLGPSFCRVTPSLRQSHGNDSASQVAPQGIDRSDISFTDEVFLLPVLKRKKKSHLHQKAIVLKKTNKLTNKTPLNDLIKSWGFFNPQSQNFLTSHSKMPRIRQCYFSQFTHKQWSTGLKKSPELIQSSFSSLQPPWLWRYYSKSHQLLIHPAWFFQINRGSNTDQKQNANVLGSQ